ncbi:MAG: hypothetical protein GF341_08845 [candidate division Zixibacteria bacterium]|nr:hypothetical protein [candidate division Zixibacteria bacterium]
MTLTANDKRLIAVEGLPGSGHTDFVRWAAEQPDWFSEVEADLGVLPPIERSPLSHVLQRLVSRFETQQARVSTDLFRRCVITDFTFDTHRLWAECLLNQQELELYQRVAGVMIPASITPDLVVYVQAPVREVVQALRDAHPSVDPDIWNQLCLAYDSHFFAYDESPVLVVRRDEAGAFHGIGTKEDLWDKVLSYQGGKTYFMGESGLWDGGSPAGD